MAGTEPATTIDCWVTILSMLVGCCLWTVLGGIVTTLLIHLNAASSEYTAKMQELYQYMAHRHLPQVYLPFLIRTPPSDALLHYNLLQLQHIHNLYPRMPLEPCQ